MINSVTRNNIWTIFISIKKYAFLLLQVLVVLYLLSVIIIAVNVKYSRGSIASQTQTLLRLAQQLSRKLARSKNNQKYVLCFSIKCSK